VARIETIRQAVWFQIAALLICAYCLYGAATGHLWFPAKHARVYLSGASAWTLVAGSFAWLASATLVKKSMQGYDDVWIPAAAIGLTLLGVACLAACQFVPGVVRIPS
jgi:hypothetical protein